MNAAPYVARHLGESRTWQGRPAAREALAEQIAARAGARPLKARGKHAAYPAYAPRPANQRKPVQRPQPPAVAP